MLVNTLLSNQLGIESMHINYNCDTKIYLNVIREFVAMNMLSWFSVTMLAVGVS